MGNLTFGFIGAIIRYVFILIFSYIGNKELPTFKAVWFDKPSDDPLDEVSTDMINTVLGRIVLLFVDN